MKKIITWITIIFFSFAMLLTPAYVLSDSIITPLTDSVNSGIINTKMVTSESLSNIDVDATVINGIAIFKGRVNSKEQYNELIRIARSVSGVKGVDVSQLKISKVDH